MELVIGRGRSGGGTAAPADAERLAIDDPLLSRSHLRLTRREGGCYVEDAGSLNGTWLDGRRLEGAARLADGAMLFFGAQVAVFRRVDQVALHALGDEAVEPVGPVATLSPGLAQLLAKLRRLAATGVEILLEGETGVGKEVYAIRLPCT